jgi:hypothetical protein
MHLKNDCMLKNYYSQRKGVHNKMLVSVFKGIVFVLFFCPPSLAVFSQPAKNNTAIIGLRAGMKLGQKIKMLQNHIVAHYYGSKLIPVSLPYDGGISGIIRPWRASDFENQSVPVHLLKDTSKPVITGADWLNNENSAQFSGGYLLSQVYRYQATGNKTALAECGRALKGIQAIAGLAGPDRFGWICKPYGERLQDFSSPDQNITVVHGLWMFLPYANKQQAEWIRSMIPAIASYWERIHYTILSNNVVWDMQKDATFMRMFKVINLLAYQIAKDEKFLAVANRLEAEHGELSDKSASIFDIKAASNPAYFSNWKRVCEFSINMFAPIQLDILTQLRPEKKQAYLSAWERVLKHTLIGYDKTYGEHYYYTEVKLIDGEYVWRPLQPAWPTYTHEDLISSDVFAFGRYPHRLYWPDATSRLPLIYLMYLKDGGKPIPYIEEVVRDIMSKLDYDRLHWMVDPHHDQIIPEIDYVRHALTSEIGNYVAAYYLGLRIGFFKKDS